MKASARSVVVAVIMLSIVFGSGMWRYGSIGAFRTAVAGQSLHVDDRTIDLGLVNSSETKAIELSITNISSRKITIVGSRSSCGCAVALGIPCELPSMKAITVPLRINVPSQGRFQVVFRFFTDTQDDQLEVAVLGDAFSKEPTEPVRPIPDARFQ